MGFVAKHAARKTEGGLHFLHLGIEQRALAEQIPVSVKSDASLLALADDFHWVTTYIHFVTVLVPPAKKTQ